MTTSVEGHEETGKKRESLGVFLGYSSCSCLTPTSPPYYMVSADGSIQFISEEEGGSPLSTEGEGPGPRSAPLVGTLPEASGRAHPRTRWTATEQCGASSLCSRGGDVSLPSQAVLTAFT